MAARRGIPITLSLVTIEVAGRLGLELVGVGLPGHFLVGSVTDPDLFIDPFGGGRVLDTAGVQELFRSLHGPEAAFSPDLLAPVGPRVDRSPGCSTTWSRCSRPVAMPRVGCGPSRLRAAVPGASIDDRAEVAAALVSVGGVRRSRTLARRPGGRRARSGGRELPAQLPSGCGPASTDAGPPRRTTNCSPSGHRAADPTR